MASFVKPPWLGSITVYLIYIAIASTFGPLQFGVHLAELNALQAVITCEAAPKVSSVNMATSLNLPQCIPMRPSTFGLVTSIYTLGGAVGSLISGPMSTRYGRRPTMRLSSVFFILGPIFEMLAPSVLVLSIGRLLSGVGAGAAIVVVPVYIAEVAPPSARGLFGALTQVMINLGILLTQLLGYFFSNGQLWRLVLATGGMIGVLQLLGLSLVPETPIYLSSHNNPQHARRVLGLIRGKHAELEPEMAAWAHHHNTGFDSTEEESASLLTPTANTAHVKHCSPPSIGIFQILTLPGYRRPLFAVISVMLAQQLCGINSIIMYSTSLLRPLFPTSSSLLTVYISLLNLLATILFAPLADRWGRKTCLLLSIAGMGSMSLCLALSLTLSTPMPVLSAVAVLLFVASFAVGLGPVPFLLASELVGSEAIGACQSWALVASWAGTAVVGASVPIVEDWLGKGRIFWGFAAMAVGWGIVVSFSVPETKGKKTLDEVWGRAAPRVD